MELIFLVCCRMRSQCRTSGREEESTEQSIFAPYDIHVCISKGNVVYEAHMINVAVELQRTIVFLGFFFFHAILHDSFEYSDK